MAKEKTAGSNGFFGTLFRFGVYKRNQGRIARQLTFAVIAIVFVMGAWRLSAVLEGRDYGDALVNYAVLLQYGIPGALLLVGLWIGFRVVNMPSFADFLIAVEAEMNKVSWPSRPELFRAAMVVLFTIFFLGTILFAFDFVWAWIFTSLGVQSAG